MAEEYKRSQEIPAPYPDPQRPGCWRVAVTSRKHQNMEAIIDAESLPLVKGKRWWWSPGNNGNGTVVLAIDGTPKPPLHQIILGLQGREHRVGHLNGDALDCRRENLVVRTHAEQAHAARKSLTRAGSAVSSRHKGVHWVTSDRKWSVTITCDGKLRQLGRFRTEIAAAHAYDQAARELFGEHARLNFPQGVDPVQLREAMEVESYEPPYPPPGMMDRRAACRMFDIAYETWQHWENDGRVPAGQWVPRPFGKSGRCKVYPIEELNRLLEEFNRIGKPYPDPQEAGCWRVPLRSWVHKFEALIDAGDLSLVQGRNWNWSPRSDGEESGRVTLATTGPQTPLARIITGADGIHERVMHRNDDPLDCRRRNLIVRTCAEQVHANRKMRTQHGRPCTSKFKGVCWDPNREKWLAQIRKDGVGKHLGRFRDELAAAEAYDEAARKLFGEHARLNFPDDQSDAPAVIPLPRAA